ncbi:Zinc-type alcohol dehydrogenase-like protein [Olavius algarvensis associated proteobacterium Delta 3]|nr:Zinc-type alcohol dehydrogenase-like protein [Olavius algarvensis associated proteobacterium Delta 3]CAB5124459.1 Zinc-type alcohol dehydrogenase-like protein [Olavius algarvensis associated proteobacterium Delta 3]
MKAWIIDRFGGREELRFTDLPEPDIGEGEVLVRIRAVGVNPVDWKIREGMLKDLFPHEFPVVLGWDMAGVVEAVGYSARRFKPGDEVFAYARRPIIHNGTYAEMIALPESYVTHRPAGATWEASAAIPLAGLTAFQSVFDAGQLGSGQTVLILGASGGVGSFAVQFAKISGATVIGLAGKGNHGYLETLGVDAALDYTDPEFPEALERIIPGGVDLVFDCIGGASLEMGSRCGKSGGRLVSITDPEAGNLAESAGLGFHFVFVEPNVRQLDTICGYIHDGQLAPPETQVFDFTDAPAAHEQMETGHTRGKIVLSLSS